MNDVLLELSKNPAARRLVQRIGLPLPMPEPLARTSDPWREAELAGLDVVLATRGPLARAIEGALTGAGARVHAGVGDAKLDVVVIDASGFERIEQLREMYAELHARVGRIARSGRVIVVARPAEDAGRPEVAAVRQAIEGFVRSLAKEIGRRGASANLLIVADGADARLAGPLRFLASRRSVFVTGQPIHVDAKAAPAPPVPASRSLAGKVALVTGAARGIGAATARLLAAEGAHVICLDRPADQAELAAVARAIGGSELAADITDPAAPDRIVRAIREGHGGLDVVVHNAGITRDRTLAKMPAQLWDQAIDVNLGAVIRITDALVAQGTLRDGGRLILLSSVAGLAGNLGQTNYAASKAGIVGLTRALAPGLAKRGITVNAIAPGFVETRLTAAIPLMIREAGRRLSALGQGGQPDDIGHAITFLATPHSQGITGQVIRVCGGAFIGA